ncbi:MoaD/ThiS family protein [Gimesia aquarii]|uniref:ThiS family protein n=1 Tax=Gimesia aquarii TaxID=2527964 RepID=A0A517WV23_9PLAN|nr:MoaD/ThiS family protein [Gimesia aquarii]QDU09094.1 ThiS family protein [Gimesia aquarii]
MNIVVEYTAQVKKAVGQSREDFQVNDGCTLQELVKQVSEKHESNLKSMLFPDSEELHPSILLFVADQQVLWSEALTLQPNQVVTILSPISGG